MAKNTGGQFSGVVGQEAGGGDFGRDGSSFQGLVDPVFGVFVALFLRIFYS